MGDHCYCSKRRHVSKRLFNPQFIDKNYKYIDTL